MFPVEPVQPLRFPVQASRWRSEPGQTTAEYALVILAAAALAALLIAWATRADAVNRLFDAVIERVLQSAG